MNVTEVHSQNDKLMFTSSTLIRPNISSQAVYASFDLQKVTCETQHTLSSLRCEPHIFPQCTRNSSWPSVRPAATFAPRAMRGFSPSNSAINIIFQSIPGRGRGSTEKRKGHRAGSLQETGILLLLRVRKYAAFASSRSDVRRMGEKRRRRAKGDG